MPFDTAPNPADLHDRLPVDTYYHLVRTLCLTLPPPPGLNPGPDALAQRNHAAITSVAALVPVNAAEADVAAMFVVAWEQSQDCLRLSRLPETTPELAAKCRAQSVSMMRQAQGALRLLLKLQQARVKREADSASCNSAAWTEHFAISLMTEALAALPPTAPAPPAVAEPPAPASQPKLAPCPDTGPALAKAGDTKPAPMSVAELRAIRELAPDLIAGAERYAALYPERAAYIRRTGKMAPGYVGYFDPPEVSLAGALIGGQTPALVALDLIPASAAQAAPPSRPRATKD